MTAYRPGVRPPAHAALGAFTAAVTADAIQRAGDRSGARRWPGPLRAHYAGQRAPQPPDAAAAHPDADAAPITHAPTTHADAHAAHAEAPTAHPGAHAAHPDGPAAGHWPLRDFAELAPVPAAVPCSRRHTKRVLAEWQLAALTESAELVVAELMTNAIAAVLSREGTLPVRLWLLGDNRRAMVVVWDACPLPPVLVHPRDDVVTGRGLLLVEAISAGWGSYATPQSGGKAVWALLAESQRA